MDDLDSCPAAANNYKEWNHLYITYKLNTLLQRKLNKLFSETLWLSIPKFYNMKFPWTTDGLCVCMTNSQPIRAQYLLEYCFSWMRSWCDLQISEWQLSTGIKLLQNVLLQWLCPNACEKVLKPEVTAGYFKFTPSSWPRFFIVNFLYTNQPTMKTSSHISWHLVKDPHYLLRFLKFKLLVRLWTNVLMPMCTVNQCAECLILSKSLQSPVESIRGKRPLELVVFRPKNPQRLFDWIF